MLASVIIRTYNEDIYLDELLVAIESQKTPDFELETVIVDSGSTDNTLEIASAHGCRITRIKKEDFSFGRSLNIGCKFAGGDYLLFISGHCVPSNDTWVEKLIRPLTNGSANYTYGRQVGRDSTKYSERRLFNKYYSKISQIPQQGYFCNNANAAITRESWSKFNFNEGLTGLEDMYLGKQIVESGGKIAYVADAPIYHIHDEMWGQVKMRYEREAIALQRIMPEIHFTLVDVIRYTASAIFQDSIAATHEGVFWKEFSDIVLFRTMHYWGTYVGNHEHRKLSSIVKQQYYYPNRLKKSSSHGTENHSATSNESE